MTMTHRLKSIACVVGLLWLTGCKTIAPPVGASYPATAPLTRTDNLALGNPGRATTSDPNNYLIVRPQYVLSYSRDRGIANWPGRRSGKLAPQPGLERHRPPYRRVPARSFPANRLVRGPPVGLHQHGLRRLVLS